MSLKLGEMLVANNVISQAQFDKALETQKHVGGKLPVILSKLRYINEDQLAEFLGAQMKLPVLGLKDLVVMPNCSALVDVEVLEKNQILPIRKTNETLVVAVADPLDLDGVDNLQFVTGLRIETAVASRANIIRAIDYYFHGRTCPEIQETEKARGITSGQHAAVSAGTRASPQAVLQALTELLIEKKLITQDELLNKLAGKQAK
ncbi:MAG TPA: hypothetical protein VEK08_09515 [Planctomycetota bacterium]|nr:hypothetical protein [Planctomycetota bacterium]